MQQSLIRAESISVYPPRTQPRPMCPRTEGQFAFRCNRTQEKKTCPSSIKAIKNINSLFPCDSFKSQLIKKKRRETIAMVYICSKSTTLLSASFVRTLSLFLSHPFFLFLLLMAHNNSIVSSPGPSPGSRPISPRARVWSPNRSQRSSSPSGTVARSSVPSDPGAAKSSP